MTDDALPPPLDVSAVRARRANLHRASARVEDVVSSHRQKPVSTWVQELTTVVAELTRAWDTHIVLTESRDGLLEQITIDAPRLASTVGRLRREHEDVATRLRSAAEQLGSTGETDLMAACADVTAILVRISRHRRDGGELIHQAYRIDIGGE